MSAHVSCSVIVVDHTWVIYKKKEMEKKKKR